MIHSIAPQSSSLPEYGGRRILEAMNDAPRYADAIEHQLMRFAASAPRILDFGAGEGLYAERLHRNALTVDCVELDPQLRGQLKTNGHIAFETLQSCTDETYDLVYSINVMEHIDQIEPIFADIFRVLKLGGRAFIFVPAFNVLWTSLDTEVGHVRRFNRRLLTDLLTTAGFKNIDSRYFDSLGFPAALTVRFLEGFNAFQYNARSIGFYDRYGLPLSMLMDRAFSRLIGKNLIAVGQKPRK